jgi:dTMP kinase
MVGAFAAGGVVVGLARTFVSDLGGGDAGYGVLFGAVFVGMGVGLWRGPRVLSRMSRRRVFGAALTGCGLALFPLALVPHLELVAALAVVVGFLAGAAWVIGMTLLGLEVPDEVRGRTFAFVASMVRLSLAVVLALAPLVAGTIGVISFGPDNAAGEPLFTYRGAAVTILMAAVLMTVVGVLSYRQMDDHEGPSLLTDLGQSLPHTLPHALGAYSATGCFIALEGGEGAGKSTQARLLESWLRQEGYDVLLTHEPGDTEIGQKLRRIVLDPATGPMSDRTETLLYAADKAEHVERVVRPALDRGAVVVTDRYVDSTLAYQGAGRSLADDEVERIARWATDDLRPHLTVLLDLEPQAGLTRFEERDRIEGESAEFHERVRAMFLRLAATDAQRYLVVDARRPVEEIERLVRERVEPLLTQAVRRSTEPATDGQRGTSGGQP